MFSIIRDRSTWVFVFATAIGLAASASAQMINSTDVGLGGANSITGTVLTPAGVRLEGRVTVRLTTMTKGDRVAVTDDSGNFGFRGLTNGDYLITIDKEKNYEPYSQNVNVFQMRGTPGQNFMLSIRLKPKAGVAPKPGVVNAQFVGVPETALAFYKKATELAGSGDPKGAIAQFELAIADYPKFSLAYNDMGVQYLKLNDLGRADDAFKSALNIDSTSFPPLLNHGMALYEMKLYAKAEPVLREVIKAQEGSAAGHFFLGQTLAYLGNFPEAQKELTTGLTLGGEPMAIPMKEAHRLLAIIYSTQGDKKRQAAELETYLKLAPNTPDAEQIRKVLAKLKGQ
ncbi:MAG: tetratricopeptide repeat protein [Pyrinomonadaceae bacterium]